MVLEGGQKAQSLPFIIERCFQFTIGMEYLSVEQRSSQNAIFGFQQKSAVNWSVEAHIVTGRCSSTHELIVKAIFKPLTGCLWNRLRSPSFWKFRLTCASYSLKSKTSIP